MSSSSCLRCLKLVARVLPSGLCPSCAATDETAETPACAPSAFPETVPTASVPPSQTTGSTTHASEDPRPLPASPAGYELVRRLGGGGMGEVYLAVEQVSERPVAMKFLRHPGRPEAFERFARELKVLANLDHPNIVRVLASDFLRADPFFTMEYVPGGPLSRAEPMPAPEAVRLVRAVAGAVSEAHAHQVIHRDLKPSNILLADDGTPKVADFGLAKRLDEADPLTIASGGLGTPGYMPPEQISSKNGEIGPWSDVYGLGATLYHLLTGRAPFVGETPQEVISHVLSDPPERPRVLCASVPAALEGIVVKCLEKDPKDRYQTLAELVADLDDYAAGRKPKALPLTPWRRTVRWVSWHRVRLVIAVAVSVLAVGLVFAGKLLTPKPEPAPRPKGDADPVPWPVPVPDPAPEVVQKLRDELTRGPIRLVGSEGLPGWHWWRLGNGRGGAFTPSTTDAAFAVSARTECLLELFPDPGIDRYIITADLRHERIVGGAPDRKGGDLPRVGLYFGHGETPGPKNVKVHTSGIVAFSDLGPDPPDPAHPPRAHYWDDLLFDGPFAIPSLHRPKGLTALRGSVPDLPGPWRRIEIEVAPDGIIVSIDGLVFSRPGGADLRDRDEAFQSEINARFPDGRVRLTNWTPRAAFGLWVYGAQVGVKNVTLTPLVPTRK